MAQGALALSQEHLLASQLTRACFGLIETSGHRVELGRWRKIQHILHLRHVADLDAIQNVHAFLDGVDFITVEIRRSLLEFGEVFDGAQASLGGMNLLVENSANTHGV
jgi:hypothetical protein